MVKEILNISDCMIIVNDQEIIITAPDDNIIIVDINNPNDDWASIQ